MLKRIIKWFFAIFGLDVKRTSTIIRDKSQYYTLYKYLNKDGTFDYETYRQIQETGNKVKIELVWAIEENIAFLSDYIKKLIGTPEFGI